MAFGFTWGNRVELLGALVAPVSDLFQAFGASLLEQADFVAGMFKLVNIGPNLGLPSQVVHRRLPAAGTSGVETADDSFGLGSILQLNENAAHFLDVFVITDDVLIAQQEIEAQLACFHLSLVAGMKRAIFRPQLLGGIASHPEGFLVSHRSPQYVVREPGGTAGRTVRSAIRRPDGTR